MICKHFQNSQDQNTVSKGSSDIIYLNFIPLPKKAQNRNILNVKQSVQLTCLQWFKPFQLHLHQLSASTQASAENPQGPKPGQGLSLQCKEGHKVVTAGTCVRVHQGEDCPPPGPHPNLIFSFHPPVPQWGLWRGSRPCLGTRTASTWKSPTESQLGALLTNDRLATPALQHWAAICICYPMPRRSPGLGCSSLAAAWDRGNEQSLCGKHS